MLHQPLRAHGRGFRQLLLELSHMRDWLLRDHARNGQLFPGWPAQSVFLPPDDPMFLPGGVAVNDEGEIFITAPRKPCDAMLLYPLAHRIPL
jgi:hypothetical protein